MKLPRLLQLLLVALPLASACAVDEPATEEAGQPAEEDLRSCTSPRRYFVTWKTAGACGEISGRRGQWVPEAAPVFAGAPAAVQRATCLLVWRGEPYARPDRDALVRKLTEARAAAAPACGGQSSAAVGVLEPIPHLDDWTMAGSVGCDVCGILTGRKVWVVLPPEQIGLREFNVTLTNGQVRSFKIHGEGAAMELTLPPTTDGTEYVDGPVVVY